MAHAFLALCLTRREQFRQATEEAETAIGLAPDLAFAHYAMASVLEDRGRLEEAQTAIDEAIRLDPEEPDYFAQQAQIQLNRRRWREALEATEEGLRLDPEHAACTNLRAFAQVQLGRKDDAAQTIDTALARDPENPFTHANHGWARLHQGNHTAALEHFREALRLQPTLEWARQGLVEALKARYPVYGLMLRYFLWMSTLSRRAQWAVILGGMIGYRVLRGVARTNPALAPWITPLLIVYGIFVLLTWTADPLFNLLLRLNRFGRYALSQEQVRAANWVGACLLLAGMLGLVAWATQSAPFALAAFCTLLLVLLISGVFHCSVGWPRTTMAIYTALVAAFTFAGLALSLAFGGEMSVAEDDAITSGPTVLFVIALLGAIAGTWLGSGLATVRPKR